MRQSEKGTVEALRIQPPAAAFEHLRDERSGRSRYRAAKMRFGVIRVVP